MLHDKEEDTYSLVGIVAAGIGCGGETFPGLYTRVEPYLDWILENSD